jgi:hypothetical protein
MMATRGTAAAHEPRTGRPRQSDDAAQQARPSLGVVDQRQLRARAERRQARVLFALAAASLAVALVLCAAGRAFVESTQLRSDALQNEIAQALQVQQDDQLQKAELVAPSRILSVAEDRLGMVTPPGVTYLTPVAVGETVAQAHAAQSDALLTGSGSPAGPKHDRSASGSTSPHRAP